MLLMLYYCDKYIIVLSLLLIFITMPEVYCSVRYLLWM